jgi:hypothetical protein
MSTDAPLTDALGGFVVPDVIATGLYDLLAGKYRRFRKLAVTPELVASLAKGTYRVTDNSVPEDAKIVFSEYDEERRYFVVYLEHESFAPVPIGQEIPFHPAPMIETLPNFTPLPVIELQPDDAIVLNSPHRLTPEACAHLYDAIKREFPGRRCLILENGINLEICWETAKT